MNAAEYSVAAMAGITITRCVKIEDDQTGRTWYVGDTELLEGKEFVRMQLHDSDFCAFMSGAVHKCRNVSVLADMKLLRTEATLKAMLPEDGDVSLFDADQRAETIGGKKQRRMNQARLDSGQAPVMVKIDLPEFSSADGTVTPSLPALVRTSLDLQATIAIELTPDVAKYVRDAFEAQISLAGPGGGVGSRSPPDREGVRWREARNAWVAERRSEDGRRITRSFKPKVNDCTISKDESRQEALNWLANDDTDAATNGGA